MTPLEIMFVLAVVVVLIVQYLHFNYKLKKERKEKEELEFNLSQVRKNYRDSVDVKDSVIKSKDTHIIMLDNSIKSWKDAANGKQLALDNTHIKIETFVKLVKHLNNNWHKHLVVLESDQPTWPSIRLSTKDYTQGYDIKSYQGSRDLENKTGFALQMREGVYTYLDNIASELSNTLNPTDSDRFQMIIKFLDENNG